MAKCYFAMSPGGSPFHAYSGPVAGYETPGKAMQFCGGKKDFGPNKKYVVEVDTDLCPRIGGDLTDQMKVAEEQMLKWAARFDELRLQANAEHGL